MSPLEHQATESEVFQKNIIAIPGTQNTPFHWETFRDESAKLGVGVHPITAPGRSAGPKFSQNYDPGFAEFRDAIWLSIEEKLKDLNQKPVLAGHSLGGLFVQYFLADSKKARLFEAGLLLAPTTPPGLPGPSKEFLADNKWPALKLFFSRALGSHEPVAMHPDIVRKYLFGENSGIPKERIDELIAQRVPESRQLLIDLMAVRSKLFRFLSRQKIEKIALEKIKIPVHIFSGKKDQVTPPEGACAIKNAIGGNTNCKILANEKHGLIESRAVIREVLAKLFPELSVEI
ncbi:MAG: alpha/beta hydrolase [Candidatus Peribacteraceae bacterium]|nr:alpha/beta hydrolase [Candidatus Peribacteraceae bacterium]